MRCSASSRVLSGSLLMRTGVGAHTELLEQDGAGDRPVGIDQLAIGLPVLVDRFAGGGGCEPQPATSPIPAMCSAMTSYSVPRGR